MEQALRTYLAAVEREFKTGIAAEHAYRPALERLLEAIEDGLNAVNDPKRSEIGAPDFQVLRHNTTIGFVEAKDIGIGLNKIEKTEQMSRYLAGFGNLILTDYLEFRWYVRGEHQQTVRVADVDKKRIRTNEAQFDKLAHMLKSFVQVVVPTVNTAQELAQRMAANAHLIRDLIFRDLQSDNPSIGLIGQREAFKKTLLPDIDNKQFADMYAQTIAYGLFAARVNYKGNPTEFSRRGAGEDIPPTNPFLRKLFSNIGLDLGDRATFLVDVLADLLARTDMDEILKDFGKATRQEDPVVHFYETFLRVYDPELREQRGVYYTPEPVVSYIVRSVDHVLRNYFGREDGLADQDTLILDPATGTGTFLYFVIHQIHEAFAGQSGIWGRYVRDHLLRRIFGFELLMAPYAVAHMKLGLLLADLGYTFGNDQRLGVYLTNTLEEAKKTSETLFAQFISEEANEAAAVKRDKPIMVVLGNPPYEQKSVNRSDWIQHLLKDFKRDITDKKLNLDNDFIKFIKFGQWRIDQTGQGILAFITSNVWLDGLNHRRMRESLRETFDDIYIVNLHGNSRKKETAPDGSIDDNVFDIQEGVSIVIFIKQPKRQSPAKIYYTDVYGRREKKYDWLQKSDISTVRWLELSNVDRETCLGRFFFFSPKGFEHIGEYCSYWSIQSIYPLNQNGIKTDRDPLFFDFEQEELRRRFQIFYSSEGLADSFKREYNVENSSSYNLLSRREKTSYNTNYVQRCLYRPFDIRWLYYNQAIVSRAAYGVMKHTLIGDNISLVATKQTQDGWCVLATNHLIGHKSMAAYDINSAFPLYCYPEKREGELFNLDDDGSAWSLSDKGRRPNLNPAFVKEMADKLRLTFITDGKGDLQSTFGPEDVFAYAYAVFHNPTYRNRYAEFLKIDFPRLPLTSDMALFRVLVAKGAELVDLHLMKSPALRRMITTYPADGDNHVERGYPKYTMENQRVKINDKQYFDGVPPDVWDFHVGGYQVLNKWLQDRSGRSLSYDDIRHYQRIVVALRETLRLMDEIDDAIPSWPLE